MAIHLQDSKIAKNGSFNYQKKFLLLNFFYPRCVIDPKWPTFF